MDACEEELEHGEIYTYVCFRLYIYVYI